MRKPRGSRTRQRAAQRRSGRAAAGASQALALRTARASQPRGVRSRSHGTSPLRRSPPSAAPGLLCQAFQSSLFLGAEGLAPSERLPPRLRRRRWAPGAPCAPRWGPLWAGRPSGLRRRFPATTACRGRRGCWDVTYASLPSCWARASPVAAGRTAPRAASWAGARLQAVEVASYPSDVVLGLLSQADAVQDVGDVAQSPRPTPLGGPRVQVGNPAGAS